MVKLSVFIDLSSTIERLQSTLFDRIYTASVTVTRYHDSYKLDSAETFVEYHDGSLGIHSLINAQTEKKRFLYNKQGQYSSSVFMRYENDSGQLNKNRH